MAERDAGGQYRRTDHVQEFPVSFKIRIGRLSSAEAPSSGAQVIRSGPPRPPRPPRARALSAHAGSGCHVGHRSTWRRDGRCAIKLRQLPEKQTCSQRTPRTVKQRVIFSAFAVTRSLYRFPTLNCGQTCQRPPPAFRLKRHCVGLQRHASLARSTTKVARCNRESVL